MFNAIIQQQTLVCVLPTPNTANHSIFEDSHGQNWNTPMMSENLTRSDHSKWKKMGEQWMTNMLVCQAGSSQIWEANRTRMGPGLGNSNLGFSIASTHLFRTGASDAESCEDGIPDGHLQELSRAGEITKSTWEIQVSSLKRMKRRR